MLKNHLIVLSITFSNTNRNINRNIDLKIKSNLYRNRDKIFTISFYCFRQSQRGLENITINKTKRKNIDFNVEKQINIKKY